MMRPLPALPLAALCCGAALAIAGCGGSDAPPVDTVASVGTVASTPIALAEVAGRWKFRAIPQGVADTSATEFTLVATGTTEGWTNTFANGRVVPMRIRPSGDSIILESGPYESVRRPGVQITTNGVLRRDGDRLVGRTVAHYRTKGADSVLTLRSEGVRVR